MQRLECLETEIKPILKNHGYEIVRAALNNDDQNKILQIMVERADLNDITIKDCVFLTKKLSSLFENNPPLKESYQLEVSSPGIERPLTRPADFNTYSGQLVKILTKNTISNKKKFKGMLKGISKDNEIEMICDEENIRLPIATISSATLVSSEI